MPRRCGWDWVRLIGARETTRAHGLFGSRGLARPTGRVCCGRVRWRRSFRRARLQENPAAASRSRCDQNTEPDDDDCRYQKQIGRHPREHAGPPQRQRGTCNQREVSDQVDVNEAQEGNQERQKGKGKSEKGRADGNWVLPSALCPLPYADRYRYCVNRTVKAARRLRRRVSSRLLSYFGRSSP